MADFEHEERRGPGRPRNPRIQDETEVAPRQPAADLVTVILKNGYWPKDGTRFYLPVHEEKVSRDSTGRLVAEKIFVGWSEEKTYTEPEYPQKADTAQEKLMRQMHEFLRKAGELPAGAKVLLSRRDAAQLLNAGKAEMVDYFAA